jgi:hypothetical protein
MRIRQHATIFLDTQCQSYLPAGMPVRPRQRDAVLNGFRAEVEGYRPGRSSAGSAGTLPIPTRLRPGL